MKSVRTQSWQVHNHHFQGNTGPPFHQSINTRISTSYISDQWLISKTDTVLIQLKDKKNK